MTTSGELMSPEQATLVYGEGQIGSGGPWNHPDAGQGKDASGWADLSISSKAVKQESSSLRSERETMPSITCPHCHQTFELESSDYQDILTQVRTSEFEREIHERGQLMERERKAELARAQASAETRLQKELSARDLELERLRAEVEGQQQRLESEQRQAKSRQDAAVAQAQASAETRLQKELSARDLELERLRAEVEGQQQRLESEQRQAKSRQDAAVAQETGKLMERIAKLSGEIEQGKNERELAVAQATGKLREQMAELTGEIERGKSERKALEAQWSERLSDARHASEELVRHKDEEIESLKDYRTRLNTKMIGESLEQHCAQQFDQWRSLNPEAYRNVSFEKDNEAVGGTKGDFIYRERDDDGTELVSIMFEMKNEELSSTNKKTNESHLTKLDQDRSKKGCEYAVLVSMLELDSELYNQGIVDLSWRYPKMYVIRPQFFLVIITLLRNAALKSLDYRRQVEQIRQEQIDITNFEEALGDFQGKFGRNVELANRKFVTAIDEIDKTIQHLQKVKENLLGSQNNLRLADDKAQGLTIRKLTRKSPLLAERFKELEDESKS